MSDVKFKLSVTYAAGHTQEYAPSGGPLSADQLRIAAGAFLNDLIGLEGQGIVRLVAEVDDTEACSKRYAIGEAVAGGRIDIVYDHDCPAGHVIPGAMNVIPCPYCAVERAEKAEATLATLWEGS